jgi:alkanesulfonate monooxygenase SsuD/methylene tetrahydromethanopterin reductase-like flavin-dependent oxidoreductase (luciferase family)
MGGPTTSDGAEYLEALRAMRRAEPKGGRRIFNPDETPEEAEERIRENLAGLDSLRATARPAHGPMTDEDRLEAAMHDEMMARLERDYTMSVVPPDFLLHEPPDLRDERIRRTRAGLAALRTGDPEEHRETLEALLAALAENDAASEGEPSSE